jgi:hypothetical protein
MRCWVWLDLEMRAMIAGIGSLAFVNVDEEIDRISEAWPETLVWPQFPRRYSPGRLALFLNAAWY